MNSKNKRPRNRLGLCPGCGMDSGTRKVTDTAVERCFVACETCGFKVGPYGDMAHAVRAWNRGKS